MPIVTLSQYARMRGVSPQTINKQIRKGIISPEAMVQVEGRMIPQIDSDRADLDIEFRGDGFSSEEVHNRLEAQGLKVPAPIVTVEAIPIPTIAPAPKVETPPEDLIENGEEAFDVFSKHREAKIDTEELRAEKLRIEIAERKGELLDAQEVRRRIARLVAETRDAILNVPAKVAPILVGMKNAVEVENLLQKELNESLTSLSRLNTDEK